MKSVSLKLLCIFFILFLSSFHFAGLANNGDYSDRIRTIQFNTKDILNYRVVTTFTNGKLIPWNKGVDGAWSGLATRSAADTMGSKDKLALPDNGSFPSNELHPFVVLNFVNSDAAGNQIRFTDKKTDDVYSFSVPENSYSNLSLFFMSAFGTSYISVTILYSDNTSEDKTYSIEDWAAKISENEYKYCLVSNLAKWGNNNSEMEKDNHYLMGINIKPSDNKKVVKVTIHKPSSGTTLTFWGATGYVARSPVWTVSGNSQAISYEGRTFVTAEGIVRLGYPGIIFRVNFNGTGLSMHSNTTSDELYLDVIVDGGTPVFLKVPKGENDVILVKGLESANHSLAVYKRVESYVGILDVISFTVTGDFLSPSQLPSRKLLFIGDSFTAGQAATVEDGGPIDPSKAIRENARLSYARLLADVYHAQCHILAYAGRGLIRDWQGNNTMRCAPQYYDYALPDDNSTRWNPESYIPDAIGICLGNNDFDTGIPDQTEYLTAFGEFISKIRRDAPDAWIFLITSPSLKDEPGRIPYRTVQKAYLDELVRRVGDQKIQVIQISHYEGVPGDWHPGGTAHRAVVKELEPYLSKTLNW